MNAEIATESGHWYLQDGTPFYTTLSKDGRERPVTLRDARVVSAVPSVTTITKCAAAPALDQWKQEQILLAALTLPPINGEPETDWLARIRKDSREQALKAAEVGAALHGAMEMSIQGRPAPDQFDNHVRGVWETLDGMGVKLADGQAERSFCSPLGYGGKCDWHSNSQRIVLDFKSKPDIVEGKRYAWDEHAMQLAAYARGFDIPGCSGRNSWPLCLNVFIGIKDGKVLVHKWDDDDIRRGWSMFLSLLCYWRDKNKYYPCKVAEHEETRQP